MKIYISGAITGTTDYMERFQKAEEYLKKNHNNISVVNPAAVNAMLPEDTTYEEYMKMAMTMLDMCDAIYLIEGWQQSRGANREYGYALATNKIILKE